MAQIRRRRGAFRFRLKSLLERDLSTEGQRRWGQPTRHMMNLFTFFGRIYLKATTVIVSLLTKTQAERLPRAGSMNAHGDRLCSSLLRSLLPQQMQMPSALKLI
jgi:hypothetical protein